MTEDPLLRSNPRSLRRSHRAPGPATGPMDLSATQPIQRTPPAAQSSALSADLFRPAELRSAEPGPAESLLAESRPAESRPAESLSDPIGRHGLRPTPPPPPRRRLPVMAAVIAVLVVLAGVGVGVDRLALRRPSLPQLGADQPSAGSTGGGSLPAKGGHPSPTPTRSAGSSSAPPVSAKAYLAQHTGAKVKLGVFIGSASDVASFGRWLGREPDYAIDFSSRDTWTEISEPQYMIDEWQGSKYRMVYTVGLLPQKDASASIANGAKGDYDHYYKDLAHRLVAGGQGNAILRLGWEFNLGSSRWSTPNRSAFIAYWRHIVTAMRSVPGQKFQFDWNVNVGDTTYDASTYYPGAAYVDYVGVDVYDVSWTPDTYPYSANCYAACRLARQQVVWDRLSAGDFGLDYWSTFAQSKGKPMSLPEWGLWTRPDGHGGGDDPYFITAMHAFIADPTNHVAYQGYFEQDADGLHKLTTLTASGKVFRKLFS